MKRAIALALWWIPAMLLVDLRAASTSRITDATKVLEQIISAPGNVARDDLLQNAQCVGTFSSPKEGAFRLGSEKGKGVVVCRHRHRWSAPSLINVSGGDPILQIVNGETDVLFIATDPEGERELMQDRVTVYPHNGTSDIVFYARSRGVSTGIDLGDITITADEAANRALYGRSVKHEDILSGNVPAPAIAESLYLDLAE